MKNIPSKTNKTRILTIALFVIIGLVLLNLSGPAQEIKNKAFLLAAPLEKIMESSFNQISQTVIFLTELSDIYQSNLELRNKLTKSEGINTSLKELIKENDLLRQYLNLPSRKQYPVSLASVIGRNFQGPEKYILINLGSQDGLKNEMPVVVFNNILVGRVVEIFNHQSKVLLLTSGRSKVPALIQNSRTDGLLTGLKENLFYLDLIPKGASVQEGETVISSGLNNLIPRGLLIGQISKIKISENDVFQRIEVKPIIDFTKLEEVLVILNF